MYYDDIIEDFSHFVEHIEEAYSILDYIMKNLQESILNADNSNNDIDRQISDIEKIFFYISHLPAKLDNIVDEIYENQICQNLIQVNNFSKKELPKQNNIKVLPIYPEKTIYIEDGFCIYDLKVSTQKPKLKLLVTEKEIKDS